MRPDFTADNTFLPHYWEKTSINEIVQVPLVNPASHGRRESFKNSPAGHLSAEHPLEGGTSNAKRWQTNTAEVCDALRGCSWQEENRAQWSPIQIVQQQCSFCDCCNKKSERQVCSPMERGTLHSSACQTWVQIAAADTVSSCQLKGMSGSRLFWSDNKSHLCSNC